MKIIYTPIVDDEDDAIGKTKRRRIKPDILDSSEEEGNYRDQPIRLWYLSQMHKILL